MFELKKPPIPPFTKCKCGKRIKIKMQEYNPRKIEAIS